jgi:hypothetical protein
MYGKQFIGCKFSLSFSSWPFVSWLVFEFLVFCTKVHHYHFASNGHWNLGTLEVFEVGFQQPKIHVTMYTLDKIKTIVDPLECNCNLIGTHIFPLFIYGVQCGFSLLTKVPIIS